MQRALPDIESFKDYVRSFGIFPGPAECAEYIDAHYDRFLKTLEKIPSKSGRLLEIGAAPFCMTLLMKEALPYEISLINYGSEGDVHLSGSREGRNLVFPCLGTNVECEALPYDDGHFDVVLCAEVIEHLTFYPTLMLREIHRILKPDGLMVLTTPNVLRHFYNYHGFREVVRGHNLYDFYSGYGPYGRHNREFTPGELSDLVAGCGFTIAEMEVCDTPERPESKKDRLYRRMLSLLFGVPHEELRAYRGSQILITARPGGEARDYLPDGLYKSGHALEAARSVFPRIP
jgi:SAM-dependent methyltransferase